MDLTTQEQHLCDLIDQRAGALLDDLKLHVGIPTGSGNQPGLDETRERLTQRLTALGAHNALIPGDPAPDWLVGHNPDAPIPPTAVCARPANDASPRILIAGHLDTVHPPDSPFRELTIAPDSKTALGPGCVDMKGGLIIAMAALEALEEAGIGCSWTVLLNSDEETGTFHSIRALQDQAREHDFGLALEPALAGGELAVERMGSGQFRIEARGRSAHVGRAFAEGVSAVNALAEAIGSVARMPDPAKGLIVSIGPIEGGSATNAVPDRARAWGNVRFPTPRAADELGAMFDALVTDPDAMPSIRVDRTFNRPAKPLIPATEQLALSARAVAESLGQQLPFASTGGVCDGNILQAAGLPTIDTLGVRGGGLHTTDEWIDLSSLVERCQLLAVLIARLSQGRIGLA